MAEFRMMATASMMESPLNPRRHYDKAKLKELSASIVQVGVIEPLVVRKNGRHNKYEIIAGTRRYRAAVLAGLDDLPVIARDLSDQQALEIMVVENDQREDTNPLEQAEGYKRLLGFKDAYDVASLAAKIGQSTKFVYDRVKLLELVPEAKDLLLAGKMTAGHAILIARLKPTDQERVIDVGHIDYNHSGALFQEEKGLFDADYDDRAAAGRPADSEGAHIGAPLQRYLHFKAVSVRELERWIDQHVRFDKKASIDPMLFPETAATVKAAVEEKEKVVQVTYNLQTPQDAKEGNTERIYHGTSWKRADGRGVGATGRSPSKPCEKSVTGVIVVGEGRGQAFKVCVNKDCAVHWAAEKKERARAAKSGDTGGGNGAESKYDRENRLHVEKYKKEQRLYDEFKRATPAILDACAEKIKVAKQGPVMEIVQRAFVGQRLAAAEKRFGKPETLDGAIRILAMAQLGKEADDFWRHPIFMREARAIGVDVAAILKAAAKPSEKVDSVKTPKKKKAAAKKKKPR